MSGTGAVPRDDRRAPREWNEPRPKGQRTKLSPLPASLASYAPFPDRASGETSRPERRPALSRVSDRPPASNSAPPA